MNYAVFGDIASYCLSPVPTKALYELRGDEALEQSLLCTVNEQRLAANMAYPLPGSDVLLRVEPERWLLISEELSEPADNDVVQALLDSASAEGFVIDATDGYCLLSLEGAGACRHLAHFCSLDLRSTAFISSTCARARVADVPLIIYRVDTTAFKLICPSSYADYLEWTLSREGLQQVGDLS